MTQIHATAIVEPGAEIGVDVDIGPFSVVYSGARIGDRCRLGPQVIVYGATTLGAECRVHAGAVLGDVPQDIGFRDVTSFLRVGDRCVLREGVTLHRGTGEGTATALGDDCFLMAFSHCGHNVQLGNGVIVANGVLFAGHVTVGDRAFISGNCLIHQFCRIGRLAMLGGGSGIAKDVPPFCMTRPVSLNRVGGLNMVGMRRGGLTPEQRLEVKRVYHLLYHSGLNVAQALEKINTTIGGQIAAEIHAFISASSRGICRWAAGDDELEYA